MDLILTFIDQLNPEISEKSKILFKNLLYKEQLKKGDVLVGLGEAQTKFYILTSGVVRSFTRDEKGKDHIRTLYFHYTTTGSLRSLITKNPSGEIYDCITDCDLIVGDFNAFIKLTEEHHDLAILYYRLLQNIYLRADKRIYELSVLNATQRYIQLKEDIPNIDNLIQQYHIASFLNITPVQLSRIRKELYSK
ncbi:hypothetical protein GCM10011416_01570 [Polaribacter pacificus]|uniref:Cyclic nucleotide-binding domain-containing protein n=1 Tax=Polaribacter pacificus TaxID=1775173 RepID=A0A917HTK0_9FLAO|nr:Crp/Fnr family transcriptional regulator [Polaribacter pacificus]GGG88884.1 hypothetical protein GCM10011416_01570 [Polaribacter pacificus]